MPRHRRGTEDDLAAIGAQVIERSGESWVDCRVVFAVGARGPDNAAESVPPDLLLSLGRVLAIKAGQNGAPTAALECVNVYYAAAAMPTAAPADRRSVLARR